MEFLTLSDVQKRIEEIRGKASDDEVAHAMEDQLHQDVLRAIAEDKCTAPRSCANAALKTLDIDFCRWCA